jgi:regulator of replication initiation timing
MAEEHGTSMNDGHPQGAPVSESPDTASSDSEPTTVSLPPADPSPVADQAEITRQLADLQAANERYKQQMQGWERQSAQHLQENARLKAERDQLQQIYQTVAGQQQQQQPTTAPRTAKEAFDKYLEGDTTALEAWEASLRQQQTPAVDVDQRINERLGAVERQTAMRQHIATRHPELADATNPLYKMLYERYDQFVADPMTQLMYPDDEAMMVRGVPASDNSGRKDMDWRVVDRLAVELKAELGQQLGRQQEARAQHIGAVEAGGPTPRGNASVEAWDLLLPAERAEIRNLIQERAIPRGWPQTERAIAKHVFEGLSAAAKQTRLAEAQRNRTAGV